MWKTAIDLHKKLLEQRPDPSFWSDNIVDASSVLQAEEDWRIFYMYLTDGKRFNPENPVRRQTMGEMNETHVIPNYAPNQTVRTVANGPNETYVMVETKFDTDSEDEKRDVEDEKLDM